MARRDGSDREAAAFAELGARSNFSLLDGASHPEEMVGTAVALGLAGLAVCYTNNLAGVVRAYVAAKRAGLRFAVGARLLLDDGAQYLVWPADRAAYGRLTRLLSLGRPRAPKGVCLIGRDDLLDAAEGWAMALVPPQRPDAAFAGRLRSDADGLRGRLALPLFCAATCPFRGDDQRGLDSLAAVAEAAGSELLATNDPRFHDRARRRLADVLTAIKLRTTVDELGLAAEPNAERCLKPPAGAEAITVTAMAARP